MSNQLVDTIGTSHHQPQFQMEPVVQDSVFLGGLMQVDGLIQHSTSHTCTTLLQLECNIDSLFGPILQARSIDPVGMLMKSPFPMMVKRQGRGSMAP